LRTGPGLRIGTPRRLRILAIVLSHAGLGRTQSHRQRDALAPTLRYDRLVVVCRIQLYFERRSILDIHRS
jgi:hypothetical protein